MKFMHISDVHLGVKPDAGKAWSEKRAQDMETPGYGKSMWEHILTSRAVSDLETERRFLVFLSFFGGGERWMCICWGWRWCSGVWRFVEVV